MLHFQANIDTSRPDIRRIDRVKRAYAAGTRRRSRIGQDHRAAQDRRWLRKRSLGETNELVLFSVLK
jgi:hypothetical protein